MVAMHCSLRLVCSLLYAERDVCDSCACGVHSRYNSTSANNKHTFAGMVAFVLSIYALVCVCNKASNERLAVAVPANCLVLKAYTPVPHSVALTGAVFTSLHMVVPCSAHASVHTAGLMPSIAQSLMLDVMLPCQELAA